MIQFQAHVTAVHHDDGRIRLTLRGESNVCRREIEVDVSDETARQYPPGTAVVVTISPEGQP